jgi:SHS2 domain-containing protein
MIDPDEDIQSPSQGWRLLDHTADIRMQAFGATLEELFINAAQGLTWLLIGSSTITRTASKQIVLQAGEIDELLVDWLREILFLYEGRGVALCSVSITALNGTELAATLDVGTAVPDEEEDVFGIKAVTYHGVTVEDFGQGFRASVVMDI